MQTTGLYPRAKVDAAGSGILSSAGGLLLTEAVRASGLSAFSRLIYQQGLMRAT